MNKPFYSYHNDSLHPDCTGDYRFGFQGQETDPEYLSGAVSFKYRVHDTRLGRFLSVDPLSAQYPYNSPYAFSENRVIDSGELEGLERYYAPDGAFVGQIGENTEIRVVRMEFISEYSKGFMRRYIHDLNENPDPIKYSSMEEFSSPAYSSMDQAAIAFAHDYNFVEGENNYREEQASGIFKYNTKDGDKLFVLGNRVEGQIDKDGYGESVDVNQSTFPHLEKVAVMHTHGEDTPIIDDEKFSENRNYSPDCSGCFGNDMMDRNYAREFQIPVYLSTPFGQMKVFIPEPGNRYKNGIERNLQTVPPSKSSGSKPAPAIDKQ
jgi:RHS repeat-associated protein